MAGRGEFGWGAGLDYEKSGGFMQRVAIGMMLKKVFYDPEL